MPERGADGADAHGAQASIVASRARSSSVRFADGAGRSGILPRPNVSGRQLIRRANRAAPARQSLRRKRESFDTTSLHQPSWCVVLFVVSCAVWCVVMTVQPKPHGRSADELRAAGCTQRDDRPRGPSAPSAFTPRRSLVRTECRLRPVPAAGPGILPTRSLRPRGRARRGRCRHLGTARAGRRFP